MTVDVWTAESERRLLRLLAPLGFDPLRSLSLAPVGDGHSNLTYLARQDDRVVVVRRPPPPPLPPGGHDVLRETRFLRGLTGSAVPVPAVLAIAQTGEVCEVPLYVMEYRAGPVVTTITPSPLDTPAHRRGIAVSLVETLAALHGINPTDAGLDDIGRAEGFNIRHLRRMRSLVVDGSGSLPLAFAEVADQLEAETPQESAASVIHNDYRIGNVVLSDAGSVASVLDWELATLGDPLFDLGNFLAGVPHVDEPLTPTQELGSALLEPGYLTRDELADHYFTTRGIASSDLDWYMAFAQWKLAVLYEYGRRRAATVGGDEYYTGAHVSSFLNAAHAIIERRR